MEIGTTSSTAGLQLDVARDASGNPKHVSQLFAEIYSEDERQAIADRHIQSVEKMERSRELAEDSAKKSLQLNKEKYDYYLNLLQQASGSNSSEQSNIKELISVYKQNINSYEAQLEYFDNNPIEDSPVRQHLYKMAASMMGISEQEMIEKQK